MTYRLAIHHRGHWRREVRTGSRRYALSLLRAYTAADIEVSVRGRAPR